MIVRLEGAVHVVLVRTVPIGHVRLVRPAAEAGPRAGAVQRDVAVRARRDEPPEDAVVALARGVEMRRREVTETDPLRGRVHEHRRGRGLEVVAFPPALVEHLPPQPGLLVLDTHRGSHRLPEDRRDAIALRRACRQQLQDVCERHREPPERAAPRVRRTPGRRIGPALALALVPGVAQQTGALVARPLGDEGDLPRDVVESRGLGERDRELGVERAGHVDAVEPHLVGVDALVPEAAARRARLSAQLLAQDLGGRAVALVTGLPVERE